MPESTRLELQLNSLDDTDRLGRALAGCLTPGATVSLVGTLGAGKTRLVQAVAKALGVEEDVTSPTFVLVNEYTTGRMPIYHFDAYRLKDEDEFLQLGPEEYFDGAGLTFIEWGNRVADCLPLGAIEIHMEVLSEQQRFAIVSGLNQEVRSAIEQAYT